MQITELQLEFLHASKRVTIMLNVQDLFVVTRMAFAHTGSVAHWKNMPIRAINVLKRLTVLFLDNPIMYLVVIKLVPLEEILCYRQFLLLDSYGKPGILWSEEEADAWCPSNVIDRSINTQGECQALCEAKSGSECVGITYSHKVGNTHFCYMCTDDTTAYSLNKFAFYRRPGTVEIAIPWLILKPYLMG